MNSLVRGEQYMVDNMSRAGYNRGVAATRRRREMRCRIKRVRGTAYRVSRFNRQEGYYREET
jgi:hypothetical protein